MKVCRIGDENSQTFSYCFKSTAFPNVSNLEEGNDALFEGGEGMSTCGIKFASYMENYFNPKDNMSTFSLKMTFSDLFFFVYLSKTLHYVWVLNKSQLITNACWIRQHLFVELFFRKLEKFFPLLVSKVLSFDLIFREYTFWYSKNNWLNLSWYSTQTNPLFVYIK